MNNNKETMSRRLMTFSFEKHFFLRKHYIIKRRKMIALSMMFVSWIESKTVSRYLLICQDSHLVFNWII